MTDEMTLLPLVLIYRARDPRATLAAIARADLVIRTYEGGTYQVIKDIYGGNATRRGPVEDIPLVMDEAARACRAYHLN